MRGEESFLTTCQSPPSYANGLVLMVSFEEGRIQQIGETCVKYAIEKWAFKNGDWEYRAQGRLSSAEPASAVKIFTFPFNP